MHKNEIDKAKTDQQGLRKQEDNGNNVENIKSEGQKPENRRIKEEGTRSAYLIFVFRK